MVQKQKGTIFDGKYVIESELGSGGMGTVLKAKQTDLGRYTAIKLLHQETLRDEKSRQRFLREGQHLSRLSHPNIISFYQFGITSKEEPYIVMEYFDGEDLSTILSREKYLPWQKAVSIVQQVCEAMDYAHRNHVLNRDLKPQNILVANFAADPFIKIIDFGVAGTNEETAEKLSQDDQKLTETGLLIGTVCYMSPEMCQGQKCTERSDIYSLGCVLYQCLSGFPPFESASVFDLLRMHVNDAPQRLAERNPALVLPPGLEKLVFKAMAKQAEDRYQSMSEFAEQLKLVSNNQGNLIEVDTKIFIGPAKSKANRGVLWKILFLFMVAALGLFAVSKTGRASIQHAAISFLSGRPKVEACISTASYWMKSGDSAEAMTFSQLAASSISDSRMAKLERAIAYSKLARTALECKEDATAAVWASESLNFALTEAMASNNINEYALQILADDSVILLRTGAKNLGTVESQLLLLLERLDKGPDSTLETRFKLNHLLLLFHKSVSHNRLEFARDQLRFAAYLGKTGKIDEALSVLFKIVQRTNPDSEQESMRLVNGQTKYLILYFAQDDMQVVNKVLENELKLKHPNPKVLLLCYRLRALSEYAAKDYGKAVDDLKLFFKRTIETQEFSLIATTEVDAFTSSLEKLHRANEMEKEFSAMLQAWDKSGYTHNACYQKIQKDLARSQNHTGGH